MNALFDSAALAIVAYAHVDGATGASTVTNSGVTTTKLGGPGTGSYSVALQTAMSQANCKDFVLVQPTAFTGPADGGYTQPIGSLVLDSQLTTKTVLLGVGSTTVDCSFSIIILRTTIPTPLDQNGNQTGPS